MGNYNHLQGSYETKLENVSTQKYHPHIVSARKHLQTYAIGLRHFRLSYKRVYCKYLHP